jgi:hypothetical protein
MIDILPHLERLLYRHPVVIMPSLGAFQTAKTDARPDAVGGVINPPARTLTFNENLTADDGLLVEDIAQTHQITAEEARELVRKFVDQTQELLAKREIVTLPGIGRLYRNYVQKIQFLPDSTNFNTDAYGLPPLQFSPIPRARDAAEPAPTPTPAPEKPKAAPLPAQEKDPDRWLPLLGLGILLLVAGGGYLYIRSLSEAKKQAAVAPVELPETETPAPPKRETAALPAPGNTEKPAAKPTPAPAAPKTAGNRRCVIVIGQFKDPGNIAQLQTKLTQNGFKMYQAPGKFGQQIGVEFNYRVDSEIEQNLGALRKLTGVQDLWIKQK